MPLSLPSLKAQSPLLRTRGIRHLALFGWAARGDARTESDLDLAIEIEPGRSFSVIRLEEVRLLLKEVLGCSVDLGEVESFRPEVHAEYERDKIVIF